MNDEMPWYVRADVGTNGRGKRIVTGYLVARERDGQEDVHAIYPVSKKYGPMVALEIARRLRDDLNKGAE